jgi:vanillate/3-O-methylgallate O-demethylase
MSNRSLEDALQEAGNPVEMLRNSQIGAYIYPVVPPEFTNWRDEQRAWRASAVLYDQSHHMAEIMISGPDTLDLIARLGINSVADFSVDRAKHFVPCNHDGRVIGDVIMLPHGEIQVLLVGRVPTVNWVQFHAETGDHDVTIDRDDRSPSRPGARAVVRKRYRFQIQGPNAPMIIEQLDGGPVDPIEFFRLGQIEVAGRTVRALRHGMAGAPGIEIWGPYEDYDLVREAIVDAGAQFGLVQVGSRAYATNTLESGWIPSPLPAVYSGDEMKAYRQWLPATGYEASGSIGGSFVSDDIEDYYLTPYELGYGSYVKFDHDFIGRDALQKIADQPHRRKVTFEWNPDDVARVWASMLDHDGHNYKYIDVPLSNYTSATYDRVTRNGETVGISMFGGYTFNERMMLSLGIVDPDVEEGDQLVLVWGEEDGGTRKTTVERHEQTEIRVRVAPVPYSRMAREAYAEGWRTHGGV